MRQHFWLVPRATIFHNDSVLETCMKKFFCLCLFFLLSVSFPTFARLHSSWIVVPASVPHSSSGDMADDYNGFILEYSQTPTLEQLDQLQLEHNVFVRPLLIAEQGGVTFSFIRTHFFETHDTLSGFAVRQNLENELSAIPLISMVHKNWNIHLCGTEKKAFPNDPYFFKEEWGLIASRAPRAWSKKITAIGPKSPIVAVIDTGIDPYHPDLNPNVWVNLKEIPDNGIDDDGNGYVDDVIGYNVLEPSSWPIADHFHGCYVSGIIGAAGNDNYGMAGVCWQCEIAAIKFADKNGVGSVANAIKALAYAGTLRISTGRPVIVNASWGLLGDSQPLELAILALLPLDIPVVASAGNYGTSFALYPAAYPLLNIIAVTAINEHDELPVFAQYDRTVVHLAAPGEYIFSASLGNSYIIASGTSASTPYVVGTLVLLMDIDGVDMALAKQCVLDGVRSVPALKNKVITGGALDIGKSVILAFRRAHSSSVRT